MKSAEFERIIRKRGAIKSGKFITRAGLPANREIKVDDNFLKEDLVFAGKIAENLADQMAPYNPRLIIPIPKGAYYLGELVAQQLNVSYLAPGKDVDGSFYFRCAGDFSAVKRVETIGIVDDVYITGDSLRSLTSIPEVDSKVAVAGVIWDISDSGLPKKLDFDLVSVVERHLPQWLDQPE